MPPLTNAAVLITLYADDFAHRLSHRAVPPTPHLDRIVQTGVTTGLMLSDTELSTASLADSLQLQAYRTAVSLSGPAGIASLSAHDASIFLSHRPASTRLILIDAASDILLAEAAAAEASRVFSSRAAHEPTRTSNVTVPATASALIGIIIAGRGDWHTMLPMPSRSAAFRSDFPLPKQSFEAARHHTSLSGFVAWSGEGLVRNDERTCLGHVGTPPGESFLSMEQVIAEPLSKTGLLQKYGA